MKTGKEHPWHITPMWKRRISGFFTYVFNAFLSLYDPVMADRIMYKTLRDQFEETEHE